MVKRFVPIKTKQEKFRAIISGKECPYCSKETELVDSACVYHGHSYGLIYLCRECSAWVGVHKGTQESLGRLANAELRKAKNNAHLYFDPIAKTGLINQMGLPFINGISNRNKAYLWLSEQMKIKKKFCHIGMFDIKQCQSVVSICDKLFRSLGIDTIEFIKRGK